MNFINQTGINNVDICCGLSWGDEAKGKLVSSLASSGKYDFVCRWAGGNNAGHTIYINEKKYKTHLIPSGVFHNIKSIIGPDCVIHPPSFFAELEYLRENGFDTKCVKVSPKAHVVQHFHISEDKEKYKEQGTTSNGIAPCYGDKFARKGIRAGDCPDLVDYLWDEKLYGNILCEGAQGFWLDINYGNYPYITSSTTLPYGACSLGFSPKKIRNIYGASKIYDTRSGTDPLFPDSLLKDTHFESIGKAGEEYGTTTGRKRKVKWLNLDKLVEAINYSGTTDIIISKVDILKIVNKYEIIFKNKNVKFTDIDEMKLFITINLKELCLDLNKIYFSCDKEIVEGFKIEY